MPIWKIIDERWSRQLHRPLHVATYYLNPAIRYLPTFKKAERLSMACWIVLSRSPTALICHYRPLHFTINVLWGCRSSAVDVSIKSMAFDERNNLTFPGQIVTVV
ncbi:hypothetical protein EJ110_NYTH38316 [Nymphaea thermarum]|nr:hypothetical protein EJ110_NYTH38316 [Nymphaea thermarum]